MNDLEMVTLFVGIVLSLCAGIGIYTKINLDRHHTKPKKLSKKKRGKQVYDS